ncbi:MAG TPA: gliding motility-associated C-terminal domain-containing protein [Saprospiraceae bacterium]|nr:gliding motility-associated C-terminal domain-containing protein [Saprospiraceae bacterium]
MVKRALLLPLVLCVAFQLQAQLPTPCGTGSQPAGACESACIFCNFNGFVGSTYSGVPDDDSIQFCGTLENVQWIGYIAGSGNATFTVTPINCADSNGLQIALYADCKAEPLACDKGREFGGADPVSVTVNNLHVGSNYFLLVDGYAGDFCTFSISVSPDSAVYEPPLGTVGDPEGPIEACAGAVLTYSVAAVSGAGAYIWDGPPGMLVNGEPVPQTVLAPGGSLVEVTIPAQSGSICVQAANSCKQNQPCTGSLAYTVISDTYRPQIMLDSVQGLSCTEAVARLEASVSPATFYQIEWTADSSGHIVSNANTLRPGVDSIGLYTLRVTNPVNGCFSVDSVQVTDPILPTNPVLTLQDITCYGQKNGLVRIDSVTGVDPFVYALDDDNFNVSPEFKFLPPGDHALRIQSPNGCEWDTIISLAEPPELIVHLDADTSIHLGQEIALFRMSAVNYPDRADSVLMTPATLQPMSCDTCMYSPTSSFRYHVTVLDSAGCKGSDEREILVDRERFVFIPNIFTPNTANGNDIFTIYGGEDVERVKLLRVLDRWGQAIYERYDFLPNDASIGWDGSVRGKQATPAVFLYQAEILFKDGETVRFNGDVTLVR